MKRLMIKNLYVIAGVIAGSIGGFLYWKYVGCISGTCPITSVWYNTTIYGAIMGGLFASMFKKEESKEKMEE